MNLLAAWHRRALERSGHVVMLASEIPQPTYDVETTIRFLNGRGYDVTRVQPELRHDQCWQPSEGGSRPRWVRSVGDELMSYAVAEHGLPTTIDRATWDRWVRRTKAVCS